MFVQCNSILESIFLKKEMKNDLAYTTQQKDVKIFVLLCIHYCNKRTYDNCLHKYLSFQCLMRLCIYRIIDQKWIGSGMYL